ncbi:RDD family protein [Paludibaculum fermentans]|uniref:RDD family protein n=1 Tax=Paludibaculum fermentans TaxID=1473598 RepID=UPI003EBB8BBC
MSPTPSNPMPPAPSLFDVHSIETPEQTRLHFQLAGIGSRFLAMAIDTTIQIAAFLAGLLILAITGGGLFAVLGFLPRQWWTALVIAFNFVLYYGYFTIFEIAWRGQTPGKRIIGIRVIKESGRPLAPSETIGRNLLRIVDQLPGIYAVGILTALFNSQSKRLGDFVAGSIVIREQKQEAMWQGLDESAPENGALLGHRLSPAHAALIEAFVARRSELPDGLRGQMAHQILSKIQAARELPPGVTGSAEAVLDELLRAHRASGSYA